MKGAIRHRGSRAVSKRLRAEALAARGSLCAVLEGTGGGVGGRLLYNGRWDLQSREGRCPWAVDPATRIPRDPKVTSVG
jgi:hypothetical protein